MQKTSPNSMRIACIGNLYQPVPAVEYGGTQRSMAQITAFQAAICGHDITLYAPSDSSMIDFAHTIADKLGLASRVYDQTIEIDTANGRQGRIRLESAGMASSGYESPREEETRQNKRLIAAMLRDDAQKPFDVVHCHARPLMRSGLGQSDVAHKTVVHQHNAIIEPTYGENPYPLICISESQAQLMRAQYNAKVIGVVPHGMDSFTYRLSHSHAGYLAWIGRFLPEKGADRAIQIAKAANMPLVIAGMVYDKKPESARHYNKDVAPFIDRYDPAFLTRAVTMSSAELAGEIQRIRAETGLANPVIFAGPANDEQKQALYGNAMATLFPISWPEPFGLVMIESMACGTPVVAYRSYAGEDCGAVAEVIDNGLTGYAFDAANARDGIASAVRGVQACMHLDRTDVRQIFDEKWSSERVVQQLDQIYQSVLVTRPGMRVAETFDASLQL